MHQTTDSANPRILSGAEGTRKLSNRILILPAQGNGLAVHTDRGIILIDAGPGRGTTAKMIRALRDWTDMPVRAICYSHGHAGYNDGVRDWLIHAMDRGDPAPELIAQANLPARYDRYRETEGLQRRLNRMQFPQFRLSRPSEVQVAPTVTFTVRMELVGDPMVSLLAAPSETNDAMAVWIEDEGLLWAGASFPGTTIANVGTPLRTLRRSVRWAETLERLAELSAKRLVPEFGGVVEGEDAVREHLLGTSEALRWLRREVVVRMNRGMSEHAIFYDLNPPHKLFKRSWMREHYGCIEYIVRDIWREENGWWDRNPTTLHPAPPDQAAAAVRTAVDPHAVLSQARALADAGKTQLALHVIDLLAMAPGDDAELTEARALKSMLCRARAEQVAPYVSKTLYETSAELIEAGQGWTEIEP